MIEVLIVVIFVEEVGEGRNWEGPEGDCWLLGSVQILDLLGVT